MRVVEVWARAGPNSRLRSCALERLGGCHECNQCARTRLMSASLLYQMLTAMSKSRAARGATVVMSHTHTHIDPIDARGRLAIITNQNHTQIDRLFRARARD